MAKHNWREKENLFPVKPHQQSQNEQANTNQQPDYRDLILIKYIFEQNLNMNPDFSSLGLLPQQYYQQYYLFNLMQQQQMFQYMMFQQQQATTTLPECKQELGQVPGDFMVKNQIESTINTNQKQLTDGDSGALGRLETNEDDTQSRVNGHWTKQEHYMYLEFVRSHEIILKSKYDKKSKKIFKLMSQFIPTRTATQCRSHHQKFNPMLKGKKKNKQPLRQLPTLVTPQS